MIRRTVYPLASGRYTPEAIGKQEFNARIARVVVHRCVHFYKYPFTPESYDSVGLSVVTALDNDTTFALGRRLSRLWDELRVF
jgi:hypothetical protein